MVEHHYIHLLLLTFYSVSVVAFTQNSASTRHTQPVHLAPPSSTTSHKECIRLLSLQYNENVPQLSQIWKWKDSVLGDGRDFFVPKPKTLTALNSLVVARIPQIQECVVLSNCARFELLLVVNKEYNNETDTSEALRIEDAVSKCILAQVKAHSAKENVLDSIFFSSMDRPEAIDQSITTYDNMTDTSFIKWNHVKGVENVCRHLCLIAAGMAQRPNRPNRPVPFRPFSSRDAHVLLQLKRTCEVLHHTSNIIIYI